MCDWRMHIHVCIRAYELMQSSHALLQLLPTGRHCRAKKWSSARIWSTHIDHSNYSLIHNKQVQTKASDVLYQTDWNIGDNCLSIVCNCHAWFCLIFGPAVLQITGIQTYFHCNVNIFDVNTWCIFQSCCFFLLQTASKLLYAPIISHHPPVLFSLHHPSRLSASKLIVPLCRCHSQCGS